MSLKLAGYKTGNANCPIYQPSAATLAFAALPGRLAWIEGDAGKLIDSGKWYDRMTGAAYPITGTLVGGADTHTTGGGITRGGAVFTGAQSVNLGSIFPVNADYSIFVAYEWLPGGSAATFLGSAGASYHAFYANPNTGGDLNIAEAAGAVINGTVDHAQGTIGRAGCIRQTGGAYKLQFNGADEANGTSALVVTDPTAIVGNIPGLTGDRFFRGSIYHLSLWDHRVLGSELAAVNTYLAEQYA
jgi:hypothetical protein